MVIWMAVALSAAGFCQDMPDYRRPAAEPEAVRTVEGVATVRLGAWVGRDFNFEAVRTDGKQATSKQEALFSASLMGGIELYDHFMILGSVEADVANKITSDLVGVYLGWHERPKERYGKGVPDEATIFAGAIGGNLTVHETDFGDFDRGIGFGAGVAFGWTLSSHWTAEVLGEYRYLKFDYEKDVVSGDKHIGGNTGWFGLGMSLRF
jgi:hypothetical protein